VTTPDFVLALRDKIGTAPLWLSGATAVIVRDDAVLLIRRSDDGHWVPPGGIAEPGEHPAVTAVREAGEESGVVVEAERLAGVDVTGEVVYENGDRSSYLIVVFRCRWVSGEPHAADGEASEVRWVPLDRLGELEPPLADSAVRRIGWATRDDERAAFVVP
jgi:ADP-ribose pyrophosphatase YjhB (NUDIX family)